MKEIDNYLQQHNFPKLDLKAVLFDMDGVLFNSMKYHAYSWVRAMQSAGLPFEEYDCYMNEGRTGESTINEFFSKYKGRLATADEIEAIYAEKCRYFEKCPEPETIPNILPLLETIKKQGYDIYIVTGSAQKSLLQRLNKAFPNIFEREKMVTAFDVKQGKPFPEPYLKALKKGNLEPWQAIVVENAPLGVRAAVAANIFTIAVNTGILKDEELWNAGANLVFPYMKMLHENWEKIRNCSEQ